MATKSTMPELTNWADSDESVMSELNSLGGKRARRVRNMLSDGDSNDDDVTTSDILSVLRRSDLVYVPNFDGDMPPSKVYWHETDEEGAGRWCHIATPENRSSKGRREMRKRCGDRLVHVRDRGFVKDQLREDLHMDVDVTFIHSEDIAPFVNGVPRSEKEATRKVIGVDSGGDIHMWDSVSDSVVVIDEDGRYVGKNDKVVRDSIEGYLTGDLRRTSVSNYVRVIEHEYGWDIDSLTTDAYRQAAKYQRSQDRE